MNKTPLTIVTAPGSLGDVNPLLAIARGLQQSGHNVLFLAAARYLHLAQRAGLRTRSLVSEEQFERLVGNPRVWHPRHGARLIFQEAVAHFLVSHYQWLEEVCEPGETILVSHMLDFAGRIYRDRHPATKFVSVLPAPALLRSLSKPPRLSGFFWERWIPQFARPLLYRFADAWIDRVGGQQINQLRRSLGLEPVSRILHRWWWSPDLVLCLFPDWFSIPPSDLQPSMRLVGFPLADSADLVPEQVIQNLQTILKTLDGARPFVFAPGTAHHHAADFLQSAASACQELQVPGVLISSDESQFPKELPSCVVAAKYLPFSELLPSAAALVHHGGIGTTSQALKAGTPQVVLPMAFDQFDNAERVADLGCGTWLPMRQQNTARLVHHLRHLPQTSTQVAAVAKRMQAQPNAAQLCVETIQAMLASH